MKLFSKEALLLGGLYGALETPFSLLKFERVTDLLFVIFFILLVMLCFNKVPKFLSFILNNYPKTSYYLCAVGWVPYVVGVIFLVFAGTGLFVEYSQSFMTAFILLLAGIVVFGSLISLIAAFILARRKKPVLNKN